MIMKLTPAQKRVIKAMREGAKLSRGFISGRYLMTTPESTTRYVMTETFFALKNNKLVEKTNKTDDTYTLTQLGREIEL